MVTNHTSGEQQPRLLDLSRRDVDLLVLLRAVARLFPALFCPISGDAAVPAVTLSPWRGLSPATGSAAATLDPIGELDELPPCLHCFWRAIHSTPLQ